MWCVVAWECKQASGFTLPPIFHQFHRSYREKTVVWDSQYRTTLTILYLQRSISASYFCVSTRICCSLLWGEIQIHLFVEHDLTNSVTLVLQTYFTLCIQQLSFNSMLRITWMFDAGNIFLQLCIYIFDNFSDVLIFIKIHQTVTFGTTKYETRGLSFSILRFPSIFPTNKFNLAMVSINSTKTHFRFVRDAYHNSWSIFRYFLGFQRYLHFPHSSKLFR